MGKRKNKNRNRAAETENVETAEVQKQVAEQSAESTVEQEAAAEAVNEQESAGDVEAAPSEDCFPAEEVTSPAESEAATADADSVSTVVPDAESPADEEVKQEEEKPAVAAPSPKEDDFVPPKNRKIVMSSELLQPTGNVFQRRAAARAASTHTPQGFRLIELFDEYEKMMLEKTKDPRILKRRILKLQEVMNAACAITNEKGMAVTQDLIRIVFDRLMEKWGTVYSEATIFSCDYKLENPAAIDKLNAFWVTMIQLVEGATYGRRITFDPKAFSDVVKNANVTAVVTRMRDSIVSRNVQ